MARSTAEGPAGPVGLVLAAGSGSRFGSPKALVTYRGRRLVDRAVGTLRDGGCDRVVVVSGAARLEVPGAEVVHNPRWESGMGSSLRTGLDHLRGSDVVVVPVDTPWLGPDAVRLVVTAATSAVTAPGAVVAASSTTTDTSTSSTLSPLVVATYGGRWAHPVLIGAGHASAVIDSAVGDVGARRYLRARGSAVVEVPCDGTGSPRDVDVPGDLTDDPRLCRNTWDTRS